LGEVYGGSGQILDRQLRRERRGTRKESRGTKRGIAKRGNRKRKIHPGSRVYQLQPSKNDRKNHMRCGLAKWKLGIICGEYYLGRGGDAFGGGAKSLYARKRRKKNLGAGCKNGGGREGKLVLRRGRVGQDRL